MPNWAVIALGVLAMAVAPTTWHQVAAAGAVFLVFLAPALAELARLIVRRFLQK